MIWHYPLAPLESPQMWHGTHFPQVELPGLTRKRLFRHVHNYVKSFFLPSMHQMVRLDVLHVFTKKGKLVLFGNRAACPMIWLHEKGGEIKGSRNVRISTYFPDGIFHATLLISSICFYVGGSDVRLSLATFSGPSLLLTANFSFAWLLTALLYYYRTRLKRKKNKLLKKWVSPLCIIVFYIFYAERIERKKETSLSCSEHSLNINAPSISTSAHALPCPALPCQSS